LNKIKINICSLGDPKDPKTWSGTPYNLYSELLQMDRLASAFDASVSTNKYVHKMISLLSYAYYFKSIDVGRGILHRNLNAKKIEKETKRSISKLTLHTSSLGLPFTRLPKNEKHYLFCDSTWDLWHSSATRTGYSKKLLYDADKLERKAYSQMDHIFPISEYVKDNLINHYNISQEKITVVGTGLGIIKPFYGEKDYLNGKILFAAKGRFEDKGGPMVLEAFKIALKSNPNLELTIVGQNQYTQSINLPGVKTHGFIAMEDLQRIFNEHSLFLMPAINEPWGLVYLEALACKMPIVGLNRNSFPEISDFGNYGFGLDEASPKMLAKIMVNAYRTPEKLAEMGLKAQEYCLNKFSWNKTVSTIVEKIQDLQ